MTSTVIARGTLADTDRDVVRIATWHDARKPSLETLMPEEKWHIIALAAQSLAQKRGFVGGSPAQDWLAAQASVELL